MPFIKTGSQFVKLFLLFLFFTILILQCNKSPTDPKTDNGLPKSENGNFEIISPQINQVINIDSMINIQWKTLKPDSVLNFIRISLFQGDKEVKVLIDSTRNQGSFVYSPSIIGPGQNFRIKIRSLSDTSTYDRSSTFSVFSKYSGTFTVFSPRKDTCLKMTSMDTIRWKSNGQPGSSIRIELFLDTVFVKLLYKGVKTAQEKYLWDSINSQAGSNAKYRIKIISENDASIYGYSNYFELKSKSFGNFIIKAPSDTTRWLSGDTCLVKWDTTGDPGDSIRLELYQDSTFIGAITNKNEKSNNDGDYKWFIPKGITTDSTYRIRIVSITDTLIKALSSKFTIKGIPTDSYEPDNLYSNASKIGIDSVQTHTITLNDIDWVTFSADSGINYMFLTKSTDSLKLNCSLYDNKSNLLKNTTVDSNAYAWYWPCRSSGLYQMKITAKNSSTGSYMFTCFSYDSLTAVNFNWPESGTTFFRDSTVKIIWTPDSIVPGNSVIVYLYKGNKRIAAIGSKELPNNGVFNWTVPDTLPNGIDYRIKVENRLIPSIGGFSPYFIISNMFSDRFEPDGDKFLANRLTFDSVQVHTLTVNDTDFIGFGFDSNKTYLVSIECDSGSGVKGSLTLLSSDSSVITFSTDVNGHYRTFLNCTKSGVCIAAVQSKSYLVPCSYTIKLSKDSMIAFKSPKSETTVKTDSVLTISWERDTLIRGQLISFVLESKKNPDILIKTMSSDSGTFSWKVPSGLFSSDDYRIRVNKEFGKRERLATSEPFTIIGMTQDKYEPDNSFSTAVLINRLLLDSVQMHTLPVNDTDYISFGFDSNNTYLVSIECGTGFGVNGSLTLLSTDSSVIRFSTDGNGHFRTFLNCTKSGVCVAAVQSKSYQVPGAYSIKVSKDSMIVIKSPKSDTKVSIDSVLTITWERDTLIRGQQISLVLESKKYPDISIKTLSSDSGTYSWKVPFGLLTSDDYRIRVNKLNGNQERLATSEPFTIIGIAQDEYEPDNSFATAHAFVPNEIEVHTLSLKDTDIVKFKSLKNWNWILSSSSSNSLKLNVSFFYKSKSDSLDTIITVDNLHKRVWKSNRDDTVYAKVCISTNSPVPTGTYSIQFNPVDPLTSINFIAPKTGLIIQTPDTIAVEWEPDIEFLGDSVYISLYKGENEVYTSNKLPNTGKRIIHLNQLKVISGNDYRIKIESRIERYKFGFGPYFSINGVEALKDIYEDDNTSDKAFIISADSTQKHTITSKDTDWVLFQPVTEKKYIIRLNNIRGSYGYLNIYTINPQNTPITYNLYQSTTPFQIFIENSSGPYYLEFYSSIPGNYFDYDISVISFDPSKTIAITVPAAGHVFRETDTLHVTLDADLSIYSNIKISANLVRGDSLIKNITSSTTSLNGVSYIYRKVALTGVLPGNDYYVEIDPGVVNMPKIKGPFFSIKATVSDQYEPDNTAENASAIELGVRQERTLTINDTDWVNFEADSGVNYIFVDSSNVNIINF